MSKGTSYYTHSSDGSSCIQVTDKQQKTFAEMSQEEINAMTPEEFAAVPPDQKRSCYDCGWIVTALSHWCGNEEASRARGTKFPGCIKCTYWKPAEKSLEERTDDYINDRLRLLNGRGDGNTYVCKDGKIVIEQKPLLSDSPDFWQRMRNLFK